MSHDPLCPDPVICDEGRGWLCDLVREARRSGIEQAFAVVDKGGRAASQITTLLEPKP